MPSLSQPHSDDAPDGEIVAAVLSGKAEHFAAIVHRYQPALLRLAESRLNRRDWAEDAVQETFYCAVKSLHSYDSRYSFRTWLWTILINQCRRRHQRNARLRESPAGRQELRAVEPIDGAPGPLQQAAAGEQARLLRELLQELPDEQADALRLRFYAGLKFHEIADAMGCSLSSAKNRVRLGLTKMSKRLDGRRSLCGDSP